MKTRFSLGISLCAVCLLWLTSCKQEEVFDDPVPLIEVLSVSPGTVQALQDPIEFEIFYQDGDGDLGENNPDVENLFIYDPRTEGTEGFRIQQLAPSDSPINIAGTLHVTLPNTGITDGTASQVVSWDVWVVDRAGNPSNVVRTGEVRVVE